MLVVVYWYGDELSVPWMVVPPFSENSTTSPLAPVPAVIRTVPVPQRKLAAMVASPGIKLAEATAEFVQALVQPVEVFLDRTDTVTELPAVMLVVVYW